MNLVMGVDVAAVFNDVNTNTAFEVRRLHEENEELFLSRQFFKYQLEECKRDRETLISEVSLLERLLNKRQSTSSTEQTRLVARYESQFEQLRAECETERSKTKPLHDQITELLQREGDLVKRLAEQESKYNTAKGLLEASEKQTNSLCAKMSDYEEQLLHLQEKYTKEHEELHGVSVLLSQQQEKYQHVSALLSQEKRKHKTYSVQAEANFKTQLRELKTALAQKDLKLETKEDKLSTTESALKEEAKKTNFLFERVKKVDEISSRHHKLMEKYEKSKQAKELLSKKLEDCQRENKELLKKLDTPEKGKRSDKKIQALESRNKELDAKLESSLAKNTKSLRSAKNDSDEKIRQLERENNDLKTKGDELLKQIKISLEKETRAEKEHLVKEKENQAKLRQLTEEMETLKASLDKKIEKKENIASKGMEDIELIEKVEGNGSNKESEDSIQEEDGKYDYDSFEDDEDDLSSQVDYIKENDVSIKENDASIKENDVSNNNNDNNSISECISEMDGEMCDESVAEIDDDDDVSEKSGLFFGGSIKQAVGVDDEKVDIRKSEISTFDTSEKVGIDGDAINEKSKIFQQQQDISQTVNNTKVSIDDLAAQSLTPLTTPPKRAHTRSTKKSSKKIITAADIFGKSSTTMVNNVNKDDDELNDDIDAILGCL